MTHGLKALLIAASTIITCIVVGLGFSLAREAKQLGNCVVEELHRYRVTIVERDVMKYDGATVYGNDIRNLMGEVLTKKSGISVMIMTDTGTRSYETEEDIKRAKTKESPYYISPLSEFTGEVYRNENDVITEIQFREKRMEEEDE